MGKCDITQPQMVSAPSSAVWAGVFNDPQQSKKGTATKGVRDRMETR